MRFSFIEMTLVYYFKDYTIAREVLKLALGTFFQSIYFTLSKNATVHSTPEMPSTTFVTPSMAVISAKVAYCNEAYPEHHST
jgi:hypothetical protein